MIITGIGSRETPEAILREMTAIGTWCRKESIQNKSSIWVRSGHADGADWAFESGEDHKQKPTFQMGAQQYCIAYLPWDGFNKDHRSHAHFKVPEFTKDLAALARKYHPKFDSLSQGAQKLQMRNGCQILGENLHTPVDLVVCWTKDGKDSGGTGQAIRIALDWGIPVINMQRPEYGTAASVTDHITGMIVKNEWSKLQRGE